MPYHHGRRRLAVRAIAVTGCASLLSALAVAGATPGFAAATASAKPLASAVQHDGSANGCHLGNGVKHVVELGFDNVHFFRDNPNVPSDLQMMPNLLNFFTSNGTFLSNNHTPLIAHTADDLLTTWTGLVRRPGRHAGQQLLPGLQHRREHGSGEFLRLLDGPRLRHRIHAERRPRHQPVAGLLGHPARHHRTGAQAQHDHARALGPLHPGRL